MTSVCTNLGALQLLMASGAESRQPSGIANPVPVGVAFLALLALFVVAARSAVLVPKRRSPQCLSRAVACLRCVREADLPLALELLGRA
jgi:hypothetical protein